MDREKEYYKHLKFWAKIVLFIWIIYLFVIQKAAIWIPHILFPSFIEEHKVSLGTFGDSFGALNTLFAGLAFAGIIVTIRQQSEDLKATRQEMKNTNREFARQIIENNLFQYANFMLKVRPNNHNDQISKILEETENFIDLAKKYKSGSNSSAYWTELRASINIIRENIKDFSTWRRTFAGWCHKIKAELEYAARPDERDSFERDYQGRLWELLTQDERRVLFLQFAFYIDPANKDWTNHEKLASKTKCMERFAVNFDKKSYNALLRALHLPGKREVAYKLEDDTKLKELMNDIHTTPDDELKYKLPKEEKENKDTSSQQN